MSRARDIADGKFANDLTVDTNTLKVDSTNNRVGVQQSAPDAELHIGDGSGSSDNTRLRLTGGTSGQSTIQFGDTGSANIGQIQYDHGADSLAFRVNAATRVTIDSDGRLLRGTTTAVAQATFKGTGGTGVSAMIGCVDENGSVGTIGISNAGNFILKAENAEVLVSDSAGNSTTVSPHNFEMIPDGASEDMAWAFYSRNGDIEDDFDNTKFIAVDITKVVRTVENLTGEKLIYTGKGSADDASKVQQDIIQGLVNRIAALETKVAALEAAE